MFKFIGEFLGRLWRFSNFWRIPPFEDVAAGVRIGSPLGGALMFLFLLFFIIAIILVILGSIFGFTVEETLVGVDAWLAWIGPSLDLIGKILIQKVLMGIVLLLSLGIGIALVFFRDSNAPGWGKTVLLLLVCLMFGYCSAVNIAAPLDPYDPSLTAIDPYDQ